MDSVLPTHVCEPSRTACQQDLHSSTVCGHLFNASTLTSEAQRHLPGKEEVHTKGMEIVLLLAAMTLLVLMLTFLSLTADDRALAQDSEVLSPVKASSGNDRMTMGHD